MLEVSSSAFASRPPSVWVNARCHGGFTARASQQLRGSGSSFAHSTSIFVATDFIRVAILWRKALKERPAMGSDTRMNKCFVRNTVPNRAGSRKKLVAPTCLADNCATVTCQPPFCKEEGEGEGEAEEEGLV